MRLKTISQSSAFCWSPTSIKAPMVAAASLAGTMSDDFSSDAVLEILELDVRDTENTGMPLLARTQIPDRAHRVDWSPHGGKHGIIAVACTDGTVYVYSVDAMIGSHSGSSRSEASSPLLCKICEHTGPVRALQFSPLQPIFLATGGDDRELKVWTLENTREPKLVPALDRATHDAYVTDLKWNPKYPHIIATADGHGVVRVWDLKTKRSVTSFNVATAGTRQGVATAIAWHPERALEIAVARDDTKPEIQIWNLKKAVVPERVLVGHTMAVTSLSWNKQDASLLVSSGADGMTIWWDPDTGSRLGELDSETYYINDVQWSPHLPSVLATASFGGVLAISTATDVSMSSKAAQGGGAVPKWLKKPGCACFGFGLRVATVSPTGEGTSVVISDIRKAVVAAAGTPAVGGLELMPATDKLGRAAWLRSKNYNLLAAAALCDTSRRPLIEYLGVDPDAGLAASKLSDMSTEDPFAEMGSPKKVEELIVAYITAGKFKEAVDACIVNKQFDDAFAIARLGGPALVDFVHQQYISHSLSASSAKRHILYVAAIIEGNFVDLIKADVPWREVLALIVTFVQQQRFTEQCVALGNELLQRGDLEGAAACFVFTGAVDDAVRVWKAQGLSLMEIVQQTAALEAIAGQQCHSVEFAQYLYTYAMGVVNQGKFSEALPLLQKAARLGSQQAAVAADRIQYQVPQSEERVPFPYAPAPIPNQPTDAVRRMFEMVNARAAAAAQGSMTPPPGAATPSNAQANFANAATPPQLHSQYPSQMPMQSQPQMQLPQQQHMDPSRQLPVGPQQMQPKPAAGPTDPRQHMPMPQARPSGPMMGAPGMPPPQPTAAVPPGVMPTPMSRPMPHGMPQATGQPFPSSSGGQVSMGQQMSLGSSQNGYAPPAPGQGYGGPSRPSLDQGRSGRYPPAAPPSYPQAAPHVPGGLQRNESGPGAYPTPSGMHQPQHTMSSQTPPLPRGGPQPSQPPAASAMSGRAPMPAPPPQPQHDFAAPPLSQQQPPQYHPPSGGPMPPAYAPPNMQQSPSHTRPFQSQPSNPPTYSPPSQVPGIPPSHSQLMPGPVAPPPQQQQQQQQWNPESSMGRSGSLAMETVQQQGYPSATMQASAPPAAAGLTQPSHQQLMNSIAELSSMIQNQRQRDIVDRAANELFKQLQRGMVRDDIVAELQDCLSKQNAAERRNTWRQLSDRHFTVIQPFLNLKFL